MAAVLTESVGEPLETLVQTISGGGARGLDVLQRRLAGPRPVSNRGMGAYPGALPEAVETKLIGDLGGVHGVLCRALALRSH